MDRFEASRHADEALKRSDAPIWMYRSGRLSQLVHWCTLRAKEQAVGDACSLAMLEDYLHAAIGFARDFHGSLNPEGARLLSEGPPPLEDGGDRTPLLRWRRITGTVWNHDDPANHLAKWREAFSRKEIASFPVGCNVELVTCALDAYLKLPHLHHPWLEWCVFDALVRADAIKVADHAHLLAYDVLAPVHTRRGRLEKALFARADRKRAENAARNAAPFAAVFTAMLDVYAGLAGEGWTISPTRVRETMAAPTRSAADGSPPAGC